MKILNRERNAGRGPENFQDIHLKGTLEEILMDHIVDYEGNESIVFEVASLKEPD